VAFVPIPEAFQKLKQYQHSHEYLGRKVVRRAFLYDRGSQKDSCTRKSGRFLLYFPAAVLCIWHKTPVIGDSGKLLERCVRELCGYGPSRARQAGDLYDACLNIHDALEEKPHHPTDEELNTLKAFIKQQLQHALEIIQTRIYFSGCTHGQSKQLAPLAQKALSSAQELIKNDDRVKDVLDEETPQEGTLSKRTYEDQISNLIARDSSKQYSVFYSATSTSSREASLTSDRHSDASAGGKIKRRVSYP